MATSKKIPRFLLPGGVPRPLILPTAGLEQSYRLDAHSLKSARCASNRTSPKKNEYVLPQPDKFRPPSHSARRPTRQPRYYGPTLTQEQKEQQKTKSYPHMMPPEGTFMHWFIHNRGIHVWIACGTLFSLAGIMFIENFKRTSPFADMLPPPRQLLTSPITFISQWLEIYKLHTEHVSAEVAERRRRKIDDVQKRSEYRRAHGLEDDQGGAKTGALFGWTARDKAPKEESTVNDASPVNPLVANGVRSDEYVDFDGKRRPVKKWLGIW